MVRVGERPFGCDALGQHSLAILQRNPAQVIAVDIDQVEDVIQDGNFSSGSHMPAMLPDTGSLLHEAERSPPLFIQSDDLTIQNRVLHFDQLWQIPQLGILSCQIVLVTSNQPNPAFFDKSNDAVTVPLDLEQPVGIIKG